MTNFKTMVIDSVIATFLVFIIAYAINSFIDNYRFNDLLFKMNNYNINRDNLELQLLFANSFKNREILCKIFRDQTINYKKELTLFGSALDTYGSVTKIYRDLYLSMRNDLYVTHLMLFKVIQELSNVCEETNLYPILFIYELNNNRDILQGYALEDFTKRHNEFIIISIATDFATKIGFENTSQIIFMNEKIEPLVYGKELEDWIFRILNKTKMLNKSITNSKIEENTS